MQRQEKTGHFHVNSKKEWNIVFDGVNNRVQSNRQFTQDVRQWQKSSIEAEKNISPVSSGPYKKSKQLYTRNWSPTKYHLSIIFDPCVILKHHKHKTLYADRERTGHFHVNMEE